MKQANARYFLANGKVRQMERSFHGCNTSSTMVVSMNHAALFWTASNELIRMSGHGCKMEEAYPNLVWTNVVHKSCLRDEGDEKKLRLI